jgi:hemerythrin-like metal-binding protein
MAFFEWKDRMSVGDPAIDSDHQTLIQYVNEMHEAALSGRGKEVLGPMLDKLAAYTQRHFAREEALWKAGNYADFECHRKEHEACLKTIAEFRTRFGSGSIALAIDLAHFMNHWLKSHALKSDKEAAAAIEATREVPVERTPKKRAAAHR